MTTAVEHSAIAVSFPKPDLARPVAALTLRDGRRYLMRSVHRFLGVCLFLAALGVGLAIDTQGDETLVLGKMAVVLAMLFASAAFWQSGAPVARPELELDLRRREIRLVRPNAARGRIVQRARFSEVGRAEIRGTKVSLWLKDDAFLAEIAMPKRAQRNQLRRVLAAEGVPV